MKEWPGNAYMEQAVRFMRKKTCGTAIFVKSVSASARVCRNVNKPWPVPPVSLIVSSKKVVEFLHHAT